MRPVPVLMYHHVSPHKGDMVSVTPAVFEGQIRQMKEAGYRSLDTSELLGVISGEYSPEGRCAVITFDDGYLDNFVYAFPVLEKYGMKALIFMVTDWADGAQNEGRKRGALIDEFRNNPPTHDGCKRLVEDGSYSPVSMDWAMAAEMKASGLVEIGSHTKSHRSANRLSGEELVDELGGSKERITARLGSCDTLCWPKGRFTPEAVDIARSLGYMAAFTTRPGVARSGSDPWSIDRIVTKDSVSWLAGRLKVYTSPLLSRIYLMTKAKQ